MLKVGLTGGIGSGKTTVANLFEQRSITIVDADQIAHALVEPGEPGLAAIVEHFGVELLDANGELIRPKLRGIVFTSPDKKKKLESILHPLIYDTIDKEVCKLNSTYCILSVPLLIETGQCGRVDRILVVDCSVELQYARVKKRDGLNNEEIKRILSTQTSRQEKLAVADDVIRNESDIAALEKQIEKLHNFYLNISTKPGLSN